jgi:hypothetical protein
VIQICPAVKAACKRLGKRFRNRFKAFANALARVATVGPKKNPGLMTGVFLQCWGLL